VGAPKARAILAALNEDADTKPVRKLHAVTEPAEAEEPAHASEAPEEPAADGEEPQDNASTDPGMRPEKVRRIKLWPVLLLALPAFVAVWSGWVGLGRLTGFGPIQLLPGIWDHLTINSAITLPIGVETYAAFALRVWLSPATRTDRVRSFAKWSALGSLVLGMVGQVAYHLMTAADVERAPWPVTTLVSCLPVVVLGCGAALAHLVRDTTDQEVND
jgi:hypothetical protein